MEFEWDPHKAKSNRHKHQIEFELAITAFDDPFALIAPDPKHSHTEPREWLIGESDSGVLVVVYTKRMKGMVCRIISARRANRKEKVLYEQCKNIPL
jgi:uncharacterized DUF497 family protein